MFSSPHSYSDGGATGTNPCLTFFPGQTSAGQGGNPDPATPAPVTPAPGGNNDNANNNPVVPSDTGKVATPGDGLIKD